MVRVREIAVRAALLAALAAAAVRPADAQAVTGGRRAARAQDSAASGMPFERGVARVVQRQLNLSPDQLTRLQQVDQRYRQRQRANQRAELSTRRELRQALVGAPGADTSRLGPLLDQLLDLQGERVALLKAEQGELRQFLTPVQRARYLGIQEFLRRRAEELRGKGADGLPLRRR